MTKAIVFSLLLSFCAYFASAGPIGIDKTLSALCAKAGVEQTIKCWPGSKEDIKMPPEAFGLLKKESILQFSPGACSARRLTISVDGVIIEGEPGKFSDISLNITFKGCIVRNIWLKRLKCFVLNDDSLGKKEGYGSLFDEGGFPKPHQ